MATGATIDASSFNRMMGDLVNIGGPGTKSDAAVRGEIASLVRVCIEYTPQATTAKIKARAAYRYQEKYAIRGSGDLKLTYNDGSRGGAAVAGNVWLRSGGKFHIMRGPGRWQGGAVEGGRSRRAPGGAHWPDWLWAQYQMLANQTPEERARLKKEWQRKALKSRGLARLSWLQIADTLGITVPGVNLSLRQARGSDGQTYLNGVGQDVSRPDLLAYELVNRMPALLSPALDGAGILSRAMAARTAAFDVAVEKGVFQDLGAIAQRYPGLLVS